MIGPLRLQFWVWNIRGARGPNHLGRNYFDIFDMVKAAVRGLAAIVFPSLRTTI